MADALTSTPQTFKYRNQQYINLRNIHFMSPCVAATKKGNRQIH